MFAILIILKKALSKDTIATPYGVGGVTNLFPIHLQFTLKNQIVVFHYHFEFRKWLADYPFWHEKES